jgi:putative peptide zinc metalloprotease protein
MQDSIFSEHWYRVAQLKPALREHAAILRHRYRAEDWWIIRDPINNRQHRLSSVAHFLVARMDGSASVESIWDQAIGLLGDDAPSQDDLIALLGDLHNADLLKTDVSPDAAELFRRFESRSGDRRRKAVANPLYLRFPLYDPDRLLLKLLPLVRRLFTRTALLAWSLLVGAALVLAFVHWDALTTQIDSDIFATRNLLLMGLAFPFMKILHELAHGLAVKHWGGEVHDMGITLLALLPVPYVDASAAAAFPDKYQRMLVGAIGIMVEAGLASLALFAWLLVEPGLISQTAFAIMVIGGISTVFVNGNPLLKFDAYYVMADAIEIPNLATRSSAYLTHLAQCTLYEVGDRASPAHSRSEACWLLGYGIGSFCYRITILLVIALYLATEFLLAGVLLAVWALVVQLAIPFARSIASLVRLSRNHRQRLRVYGAVVVLIGTLWLLLFSVPFPSATSAEGVVWLSDRSIVRAGTDCFVDRTVAQSGAQVEPGDVLVKCSDPELLAEKKALLARRDALRYEYRGHGLREQVKRKILADEIAFLSAELQRLSERIDALTIRAATSGTFLVPDNLHLPGRYLNQGELLAYVVSPASMTLRTAITQERIDLVREQTESIQFRLASAPARPHPTEVVRHLPAATPHLPTAALGSTAGGRLPVVRTDPDGTLLNQEVFLVDLELDTAINPGRIGERAQVLFDHGREVLADQWGRSLRLLFLKRFSV